MIHLCLELRANRRGAKIKLKLVLLTVECKGLPPRSADSRTWCLVETNWRVKAQFAERIRVASRVGPHFRLVPHDATADF